MIPGTYYPFSDLTTSLNLHVTVFTSFTVQSIIGNTPKKLIWELII